MNNVLLYIGGLIVIALAALFAVPTFIDWNGYRGVFEEQAGRVLGRDVRVGGTVNVRLLPAPYVKFEKIRISDSGDASGEPIFRAESFKLWLAVPPLLRGVFEANEIELKRPVLRLTANESGGGNWTTLTFAPASLPFVPADVTLEQVRIINGTVVLSGARGQELASVEKVNGELSAESLEGPFKFKGSALWDGGEREIRFATARPEQNGDVRFKTNVIVPASKNSYQLDGRVAEIKARPRIDAELTAKVTVPSVLVGSERDAADGGASKPDTPRSSSIDVRGKVVGDAFGMKAQDLTLSLEQVGTPQIVSGQASLDWTDKIKVDLALGSRWLDLDRAAASGGARPLDVSRGLFEGLTSLLPAEAETNVGLTFDQVNLGAEAVSGVQLTVVRAGGPLELKEFRASVPGGGRLGLDGVLSVGRDARFDGNLSLDGQSLVRFLTWAFKDPGLGEGRTDTPFAVSGRMTLADKVVALKNARAEFGSLPVRGDVKLDLDQRRRLTLSLEGSKIDAGQLFPGSIGLRALSAFKAPKPAGEAEIAVAPATPPHLFDPAKSDMVVNVRADQLLDGERVLNNVAVSLALEGDKLVTNTLKFSTSDGLSVDIAGEVAGVRASPIGIMRGTVGAKSPESVNTLLKLLDLEGDLGGARSYFSELTPFDLAGSVSNGVRTDGAVDIKADGTVDGGRFVADIRTKSGPNGWTAEPANITASLEGSRAARMIAALTRAGTLGKADQVGISAPRSLLVKAAGTPDKGLVSLVSLHGEGMALDYSGRITLPKNGAVASAGTMRIAARDARETFALLGLPLGAGSASVAIEGETDLIVDGPGIALTPKRLKVGASTVAGSIKLDRQPDKPLRVSATLDVDRASIPGLLMPMLSAAPDTPPADPLPPPVPAAPPSNRRPAQTPPPAPAPLATAALTTGLWPDQVFDLAFVDRVEGTIDAKIKALSLDEGLTIGDARLQAVIEPQKVRVASLEGSAVGGKLTSDMTIEKAPAGVGLTGKLRIGVGEPAGGAADTESADADKGAPSSLQIEFSGRALSPAALMTDLKGKGEIALGDVTLTGMGPGPVARTVEAALQGKGPTGGQPLTDALKAAMKQGQLKLGAVKIPVSIFDGAMRLDKVSLETDEGRSAFVTAIELATMKIDSEWKIEAKIKSKYDDSAGKVMLPPVAVVYSGKLKDFVSIEPAIEIGPLERELTVRKMERDVDELERLRKLDQSKAKALEDERAKAAAEAAAATSEQGNAAPAGEPASGGAAPPGEPNEPAVAATNDGATGAVDGGAPADSTATPTDVGPAPVRKYRPPPPKRAPPATPAWKPFQITPY